MATALPPAPPDGLLDLSTSRTTAAPRRARPPRGFSALPLLALLGRRREPPSHNDVAAAHASAPPPDQHQRGPSSPKRPIGLGLGLGLLPTSKRLVVFQNAIKCHHHQIGSNASILSRFRTGMIEKNITHVRHHTSRWRLPLARIVQTSKPTEGEVSPAGCAGVVCTNETNKKKTKWRAFLCCCGSRGSGGGGGRGDIQHAARTQQPYQNLKEKVGLFCCGRWFAAEGFLVCGLIARRLASCLVGLVGDFCCLKFYERNPNQRNPLFPPWYAVALRGTPPCSPRRRAAAPCAAEPQHGRA